MPAKKTPAQPAGQASKDAPAEVTYLEEYRTGESNLAGQVSQDTTARVPILSSSSSGSSSSSSGSGSGSGNGRVRAKPETPLKGAGSPDKKVRVQLDKKRILFR